MVVKCISNDAQAGVNGAIVYGYDHDSTNKETAPKMTIDTMTITNILGGNNAFIISDISLLVEQLSVHTSDVSDTWLDWQRTNLFNFSSNTLRSYQIYFNQSDFTYIRSRVFALDDVTTAIILM